MKKTILFCLVLIAATGMQAAIELPEMLAYKPVLQQQSQVNLWGTAAPYSRVLLDASWGAQAETTANGRGQWIVSVSTPAASYTMHRIEFNEIPVGCKIRPSHSLTLDSVLIGEVWLGGGQSNMEMPLEGFWKCPIRDANAVIAAAGQHKDKIRYATIRRKMSFTPEQDAPGQWKDCTAANAATFGAAAYFFAETLQQALDVPVGIINCSWGGTHIESWLPREILATYPDVNLSEEHINSLRIDCTKPMVMYNAMLYPLHNYTVKGFLWYQGCSNVGHADTYAQRSADMITHWRQLFGQGDLPFYFVEIAPFQYNNPNDINAAELREAQWKVEKMVSNCAGVSTNDITYDYEIDNIHPANKQDVGKRLAFLALHRDYGMNGVHCYSPQLDGYEIHGNEIYLFFTNCRSGLANYHDLRGFEIAGSDGVFVPAHAKAHPSRINGLIVSSPEVEHPVAARYCFRNFLLGNAANLRYMPIVPFRTDKMPARPTEVSSPSRFITTVFPAENGDAGVCVYLPAGYDDNDIAYPVLYLLHGSGDDEEGWNRLGHAKEILDNMIGKGLCKPMVVIMPNGFLKTIDQMKPEGDKQGDQERIWRDGKFESSFPRLIAWTEQNYRIAADKQHRAIAGLSMGGFHSMHIAHKLNCFNYVGLFSAALREPNADIPYYAHAEEELAAQFACAPRLYWIAMGEKDYLHGTNVTYRHYLDEHGYKYEYHESEGGHSWKNWMDYLQLFLPRLF